MPTLNLATLLRLTWDGLDNNYAFYQADQIARVLTEGLRRLNLIVGFYQVRVPLPGFSVAGQMRYLHPPGVIVPMRVYFEGRELGKSNLRRIALRDSRWFSATTANRSRVSDWVPIGVREFILYPADMAGGNLIETAGTGVVPPLVNPGDTAYIDDQFTDLLVDYAKTRLLIKEGGTPFATAVIAQRQMIRKLKTMTIWRDMKWPSFWLDEQSDPSGGKAA